jgi:monoterpene epsilon-lactone hydrolase
MPSDAHEAMVGRIVATGVRTPETLPGPADFEQMRRLEATSPLTPPAGTHIAETTEGGVPAIWVTPNNERGRAVILYFHGGGYIWMSARTHLEVMGAIARTANARCLGIDYRRAPEHPYPAAVEDAVATYQSLLVHGTSPSAIVLGGDSAGGGLALSTLIALRDRGTPLPAGAVCISPWTDLTVSGATADTADDPVVSGPALRMMAHTYLAGASPRTPTASPLFADLSGLPPLLLQVGTREALLDDTRRLALRARAAGVDTTLIEHPGVVHMWIVFDPTTPEAHTAFQIIAGFVSRRTTLTPGTSGGTPGRET